MNIWTDTKNLISFLTLFVCFFSTQSQTITSRTAHKINNEQPGVVDLAKQNSITQQILAQYLQKRLTRAGLNQQPPLGVVDNNKKLGENPYTELPNEEDLTKGAQTELYQGECSSSNCVDSDTVSVNKLSLQLLRSGEKKLYLGIFFKANWYKAAQYCRYHGMHLASISSQEENDKLEKYIKDFGMGHEHFWTSGTDQAEEGSFFWLANGRPIGFTNWNAGEPNNFKYENGEEEHCLELWNRDGKGLKWNDSPCSFETFFVCEM
ncbi:low affinity immunoglobulin epsilon Fc receptor [Adelges cooleyi]|uniref:low affinity immunoglobulin epsilon Fc receptor n=1 Tax=Adelges cooleyi TaxID=133065 RepID=UPI00217FC876|nr:low affinity immunoglobulin epsilon Fc receptor [Adelges cooleyi]